MSYTREQKAKAFDQLLPVVKNYYLSDDLSERIAAIGRDNALLLDKVEILGEYIYDVILGLEKADSFQGLVERGLGAPGDVSAKVIKEVNENIFEHVRELLKEKPEPTEENTPPAPSTIVMTREAEQSPAKEDILAEIENPTPVEHPISIAKEIPAFPLPKEIVEERPPEKTGEAVAHNFIAEKLAGTVSLPSQKTVTEPEKLPEKPKGYAADPYREPLV